MNLRKGDNIYLLKRFNLKENNKYKITFLLNDVYVKNNSIYIDNYSILEKTSQTNRMHSNNSRIKEFFEREYNKFCWSMVTGKACERLQDLKIQSEKLWCERLQVPIDCVVVSLYLPLAAIHCRIAPQARDARAGRCRNDCPTHAEKLGRDQPLGRL